MVQVSCGSCSISSLLCGCTLRKSALPTLPSASNRPTQQLAFCLPLSTSYNLFIIDDLKLMALSLLSLIWVWIRAPTWTRGGSDLTSYVHSSSVTSEFLSLYLSFRKAHGEILPQNKNSSRKSTATWKLPWEGFAGRSDELTGYMQLETWLLAKIRTFAFLCLVEAAVFELDSGWREKRYVRINKPFFMCWGVGPRVLERAGWLSVVYGSSIFICSRHSAIVHVSWVLISCSHEIGK